MVASRRAPHRSLRAAAAVAVVLAVGVAAVDVVAHPGSGPSAATGSSTIPAASGSGGAVGSAATPIPSTSAFFPGGLLIADRANGRILVVNDAGAILWRFPRVADAVPAGQHFTADDAFIDPSGHSIVANDEFHEVIDRIDIATGRITWQYGRYGVPGAAAGELHTPDDAYPLANGDVMVADIENCRVLEIGPDKSIARQWGRTGVCRDGPGPTFARPNGDTPLPDGGLLVTEIVGSRVVRLGADGHVVFDIHVPVHYPSDAQLDANGDVVVADFSTHGQVVAVDPATGTLIWRYAPRGGPNALNHPSLATPLPGGLVSVNDDFRHRLVVIDPAAGRIVWQYGVTDVPGTGSNELNTPDGHQPLPVGLFAPP